MTGLIKCKAKRAFTRFVSGFGMVHGDPESSLVEATHPAIPATEVGDLVEGGLIEAPKGWAEEMAEKNETAVADGAVQAAPSAIGDDLDQLDHDGDGTPGGSISATGDLTELRAEYTAALGKKPFNGWDADELRRRIAAHDAEEIPPA